MTAFFVIVAALALTFSALWVAATRREDVSIVDIFWGPGFLLSAVIGACLGDAPLRRKGMLIALVGLWSLRLAIHLWLRGRGHPEDPRYRAMRIRDPEGFVRKSLLTVFLFQAALVAVISLPLQAAVRAPGEAFGALAMVGGACVLVGIALETTADLQLQRFRRDPLSHGKVLDRGLWRYSRHPNYFGDAVVWVGFGLIGLPWEPIGSVLGPALMILLLLKVSGVSLLEETIGNRRPDYADYIARTSAFIPWPPKR